MEITRRLFCSSLIAAALSTPVLVAEASPHVVRDISYGSGEQQSYDLYLPSTADEVRGVVVFLHGGAWRFGDKSNRQVWRAKSAHFNRLGLAFASANTRLLPDADPLLQADDLAAAIAHLQTNAKQWGIDARRTIVAGHSAGAHVAALVAADPSLYTSFGLRPWRGTILLDSAALDVEQIMADQPARLHRRAFGTDPKFWRAASPFHRLKPGHSPFMLVCSTKRGSPCRQAQAFDAKSRRLGGRSVVLPVSLSHRDINSQLGRRGSYTESVTQFMESLLRD
ncbi:MAG: alpha/beta hydrolase [Pseudomonadota bacterium]